MKQKNQTRIDAALALVEEEASFRVKELDDKDYARALYGVMLDLDSKVGEKMRLFREEQRNAKEKS